MTPFIGLLSPVSMALEPVIIVWTREASLATLLAASFPKSPQVLRLAGNLRSSGPGRGPLSAVIEHQSLAISWRITGSLMAPVSRARSTPDPPSRLSVGTNGRAHLQSQSPFGTRRRWAERLRSPPPSRLRSKLLRSCAKVVMATGHPFSSAPIMFS